MKRRSAHLLWAVLLPLAALQLLAASVRAPGQTMAPNAEQAPSAEQASSVEVDAPTPRIATRHAAPTPQATPSTDFESAGGSPAGDSWSRFFLGARGQHAGVSRRADFRMASPPGLFSGVDSGPEMDLPALRAQGVLPGGRLRGGHGSAAPGQTPNLNAAARGNMSIPLQSSKLTLRLTYPALVGPGSMAASQRGMFATSTNQLNSVGIFTSNGSGLSFGKPSGMSTIPGANGQRRGNTGPQLSLKLKF